MAVVRARSKESRSATVKMTTDQILALTR